MTSAPASLYLHYLAAERLRAAAGPSAEGLCAGDVFTLAALCDAGGTSAAVLADRLTAFVPSVRTTVDRLTLAGYVEAGHGAVRLTPTGVRLRRRLSHAVRRIASTPATRAAVSLN